MCALAQRGHQTGGELGIVSNTVQTQLLVPIPSQMQSEATRTFRRSYTQCQRQKPIGDDVSNVVEHFGVLRGSGLEPAKPLGRPCQDADCHSPTRTNSKKSGPSQAAPSGEETERTRTGENHRAQAITRRAWKRYVWPSNSVVRLSSAFRKSPRDALDSAARKRAAG